MKHRNILIGAIRSLALLLLLAFVAGCSQGARTASSAASAAPVTVVEALDKDVPDQVQAIGHVTAFATVAVKSLVDGQLASALFQEGDAVKQGETI
jgi:multidrug efflux system membrane fusion protein